MQYSCCRSKCSGRTEAVCVAGKKTGLMSAFNQLLVASVTCVTNEPHLWSDAYEASFLGGDLCRIERVARAVCLALDLGEVELSGLVRIGETSLFISKALDHD